MTCGLVLEPARERTGNGRTRFYTQQCLKKINEAASRVSHKGRMSEPQVLPSHGTALPRWADPSSPTPTAGARGINPKHVQHKLPPQLQTHRSHCQLDRPLGVLLPHLDVSSCQWSPHRPTSPPLPCSTLMFGFQILPFFSEVNSSSFHLNRQDPCSHGAFIQL